MSLRNIAEKDLGNILADELGFTWPIVLTNPSGEIQSLQGFSNDIALTIDPETGQAVSGRTASIALQISAITIGFPVAIADANSKPWLVAFDDINGNPHSFKVIDSNPDRGLGCITCVLEAYAIT